MPLVFDPARTRKSLLEFQLGYELARSKQDFLPNAVGNAAINGVATSVSAWLVGLNTEIGPALLLYRDWLEDSIARDEQFGESPAYFASRRSLALGHCRWMLEGKNATNAYRDSTRYLEAAWDGAWSDGHAASPAERRRTLDDYVASCLQSGDYERAVRCAHDVGLQPPPKEPEKLMDIGRLGVWLCHQYVAGHTPGRDLPRIFSRCLDKNLPASWLGGGHYLRATSWLKIVYWHSGVTTDPLSTILEAYAHMPNVQRP